MAIAAFSRQVPDGQYVVADDYQKRILEIADEERATEYKSHKVLFYSRFLAPKIEKNGFRMIVRSGDSFYRIVKDYFERYPDETVLIYSMWSGYKSLPGVKQMLDIATRQESIHVSGHVTKEDLEKVICIVKPDKLIIHHTSASVNEENNLTVPDSTKILPTRDCVEIEV